MALSKTSKFKGAAELYIQAGDAFKKSDYIKAGESYMKASTCYQQIEMLQESAQCAETAGTILSEDPNATEISIQAFNEASRIYREMGKPRIAAKLMTTAGNQFMESQNFDGALSAYKEASQIYEDENDLSTACEPLSGMGDILTIQKKFLDAAKIYDKIASARLSDRLTKLAAREFYMKSLICQLAADDSIGAQAKLKQYLNSDPGWDHTREVELCRAIIKAYDDGNPDQFAQAVYDYDKMKGLDDWMTNNLLSIKKMIEEADLNDAC